MKIRVDGLKMSTTMTVDQASRLLDFNQKLDINLLDSVVGCMLTGIGQQVCIFKVRLYFVFEKTTRRVVLYTFHIIPYTKHSVFVHLMKTEIKMF